MFRIICSIKRVYKDRRFIKQTGGLITHGLLQSDGLKRKQVRTPDELLRSLEAISGAGYLS